MASATPCVAYAWTLIPSPPGETCDVSVGQLWREYLSLGGSMPLVIFYSCLDGQTYCGDVEHDLIVQTLNEHLLDHGHRFPIPYVNERSTGESIDFTRLPQRCRARHRAPGGRRRGERG